MSEPQEDPDVRAMSRLREGEDLALDEIMDRWQGRLMSYLFRLTGNETVAIDLAQETFVRVYQHRERYRATGAFSSWLFAIATNLARHHIRWKMRHHSISMDARSGERPHGVEALPAPDPGPGDHLENEERANAVREAVSQLSPGSSRSTHPVRIRGHVIRADCEDPAVLGESSRNATLPGARNPSRKACSMAQLRIGETCAATFPRSTISSGKSVARIWI